MSINFAGVQSMTIPQGKVVKITDAAGRVLWQAVSGKVVLGVEKKMSNTYAGETTYENEVFILLDIYPKTNGTVTITYGGLTKTITDTSGAESPNAQQVFFGTFNGVTDSVETPANGELTIEGAFYAFGCGVYYTSNKLAEIWCRCITSVIEWGENITEIPRYSFYESNNLYIDSIPRRVTKINNSAFYSCIKLPFGDNFLNHGLVHIGSMAFDMSQYGVRVDDDNDKTKTRAFLGSLAITIPASVTTIDGGAFGGPIVGASGYTYFYRVTVLATTPPVCGTSTGMSFFGDIYSGKDFSIIVPKGCGEAYKAADGWNKYADYIVEAT